VVWPGIYVSRSSPWIVDVAFAALIRTAECPTGCTRCSRRRRSRSASRARRWTARRRLVLGLGLMARCAAGSWSSISPRAETTAGREERLSTGPPSRKCEEGHGQGRAYWSLPLRPRPPSRPLRRRRSRERRQPYRPSKEYHYYGQFSGA
jgi:hypothetical protein